MSAPPQDHRPTGRDLADALRAHAESKGIKLSDLVRPLHPQPISWLNRLATANAPLPGTVKRVHELLAGELVTPPRSYSRSRSGEPEPEPDVDRPRVYRDPCAKCGVRGDLGCRHRPPIEPWAFQQFAACAAPSGELR